MPRELTLQESDGLFDLLHSNDLRSISQARVLADSLQLREHPEYTDMVLSGFEEFFSSDNFDELFKRLFSEGEIILTDFEIDEKEVVLYFDYLPGYWLDEREGKSLAKEMAKDISAMLKKKLGVNAKLYQFGWEIQDDHDHDGFRALPGREWVVVDFSLEFPFKQLS